MPKVEVFELIEGPFLGNLVDKINCNNVNDVFNFVNLTIKTPGENYTHEKGIENSSFEVIQFKLDDENKGNSKFKSITIKDDEYLLLLSPVAIDIHSKYFGKNNFNFVAGYCFFVESGDMKVSFKLSKLQRISGKPVYMSTSVYLVKVKRAI